MPDDGPRVLVADDEPLIRQLIVEALEDAGYNVLEAESGLEALQIIDDLDHVDMVVTDINMPGCDGFAVAAKARSHHPRVPVLFMSGRDNQAVARRTPAPSGYLAKPFRLGDLVAAAGNLIIRS
jgi:two-component system, response regulator PdtaR